MTGQEIDDLIRQLAGVRDSITGLRAEEARLVAAIHSLCQGSAKTRRLCGTSLRARVETADPSWDQAKLRILWHSHPGWRGIMLRIEKLGVSLREYNKIQTATGGEDFEAFKAELAAACLGVRGTPRVTVEEPAKRAGQD